MREKSYIGTGCGGMPEMRERRSCRGWGINEKQPERGCSPPRGMSCCKDSMTTGAAEASSSTNIGDYTLDKCITECKKRPGVNGITMSSSVTAYYTGPCFCLKGVTVQNSNSHYDVKSCYLQPRRTDCQWKRESAWIKQHGGVHGVYIPKCTATGEYKPKQCHPSTASCWCVDPTTGKEIKGSRKRSAWGAARGLHEVLICDKTNGESGCIAPHGMSCCHESMTTGDAIAESELPTTADVTLDECIAECMKRPGVNGVTVERSVTSYKAGGCWCQTGVTGQNSISGYKTCYLNFAVPTLY